MTTYYVLKHTKTGEYMPQAIGKVGYSFWIPGTNNFENTTGAPRLITSFKKAARARVEWAKGPRQWVDKKVQPENLFLGMPEKEMRAIPCGRKLEDLEICMVVITEIREFREYEVT